MYLCSYKLMCFNLTNQKISFTKLKRFSKSIKFLSEKELLRLHAITLCSRSSSYLNNIDSLLATAQGNKVATTLGVQDLSQLRKDYGKEQADVIMNITGNIISDQISGDNAKELSISL
jgi:hypothetical protein